jgi:hypothetical protein
MGQYATARSCSESLDLQNIQGTECSLAGRDVREWTGRAQSDRAGATDDHHFCS